MIEDVKNFGIKTSAEEKANRIALCNACEERRDSTCNQCACPIDYVIEYAYKKCPLDKWTVG
jgi:hypothetical protein